MLYTLSGYGEQGTIEFVASYIHLKKGKEISM